MQTECSADLFGFARVEGRAVVAAFDGGRMTSEAGAVLLGATDRQIGLVARFAGCFTDHRAADLVEHTVATLVGQRVFGIALGYEDLIDHDQLRHDPVLAVLGGKLEARRSDCAPLAGKSTLNRLELSRAEPSRYHKISYDAAAIEALFVDLFVDAHAAPPAQITLDLDATDDPAARPSGGALLPRLLRQLLLSAALRVLRPASAGIEAAPGRHRRQCRQRRGDGADRGAHPPALAPGAHPATRRFGFAREALMAWCENNAVDFLFGLAKNTRLVDEIKAELAAGRRAEPADRQTGAHFKDFTWQTRDSWSRARRVVAKAEWTEAEANPRFVVTSLSREEHEARHLYEKLYCARGEMETASRNASSTFMPTAPRPRRCAPPAAPVVCLDGLCADLRLAPHWPGPHPVCPRLVRHDPPQAV